MPLSGKPVLSSVLRRKLAGCIAATFWLAAPGECADTLVTNCNDSGTGSLRAVITAAPEGSAVDMTHLTTALDGCLASSITLSTGDIVVGQNSLTIQGPTSAAFSVSGKNSSPTSPRNRILTHTGTGTLTVSDLTVGYGYLYLATGDAFGGCINSAGSLVLNKVQVIGCKAVTKIGTGKGGGVYTKADLTLNHSVVSHNAIYAGDAYGGGVYVKGALSSHYTSISYNSVANANTGAGGGAFVNSTSSSKIDHSTLNGNVAGAIGGIEIITTAEFELAESTISGNVAKQNVVGGIFIDAPSTKIYSSTIAFNTATERYTSFAPGLALFYGIAQLESTIVASNGYINGVAYDLSAPPRVTLSGHKNLIVSTSADVPSDTVIGACALLGPLRNNGGLTKTHALMSHSPAIDAGNNAFGSEFDQRGSPQARVSGPPGTRTPLADIGAFEVDQADEIFDVDFEGCQ